MKLPSYSLLSKEQDRILNLPLEGSYLVGGPPGSGKTVVALYRAQMLSQQNKRSVLLVFNNALKSYVTSATKALKVSAETVGYFRWLDRTYKDHYACSPPMISTFVHDWPRILATVNAKPPPRGLLPYLIIDEGQDLAPQFYMLARYFSQNLTVLADGNQVLHRTNSTFQDICANAMITEPMELLTNNYRNSRQIALLAAQFHSGIETGIAKLPTRKGPPIVLKNYVIYRQAIEKIRLFAERNSSAEIGVFLPDNKLVKTYARLLEANLGSHRVQQYRREWIDGKNTLIDTLDFSKPAVRIMTYWLAKGLEFDAVFLPDLQKFEGDVNEGRTKMLFYVLLSRAREYLYLYHVGEETSLVKLLKTYIQKLDIGESKSFDDDDFEEDTTRISAHG